MDVPVDPESPRRRRRKDSDLLKALGALVSAGLIMIAGELMDAPDDAGTSTAQGQRSSGDELRLLLEDLEGLDRDGVERARRLDPEHPELPGRQRELAEVVFLQGELDEAEELYQDALALDRERLGPRHPDVAKSWRGLAFVAAWRGDRHGAEELLRQALELRQEVLGEHPDTAESLHDLGRLRLHEGELDAAEPLLRHALELQRRLLGDGDTATAATLTSLAQLHLARGAAAVAEPLARQAREVYWESMAYGGPFLENELALIRALIELERYAEAEEVLHANYASLLRERGPDDADTEEVRRTFCGLYRAWGREPSIAGC